MSGKTLCFIAALAIGVGSFACQTRSGPDRAMQGAHAPTSPAESGEHGATAFNPEERKPDMYQTAGLDGEMTNGKVDPTMEGSGNLAWQGNYERERRAQAHAAP